MHRFIILFYLLSIFSCSSNKYPGAKERIDRSSQLLANDSSNIGELVIRANAYSETGNDTLALIDLNRAIESGSSDSTLFSFALVSRGDIYYRFGRNSEAIKDFNRAIHIRPSSIFAYLRRGMFKCKTGDPTACDDLLKAKELGQLNDNSLEECCEDR